MSDKKVRITGYIMPQLDERTRSFADDKKWDISVVIEEALISYLEENEGK